MLQKNMGEFKRAVEKSNGRVLVVMHPGFDPGIYWHSPEYNSFPQRLDGLVKKSKIPVVVFEIRPGLKNALQRFGRKRNHFFIETPGNHVRANPKPSMGWRKAHELFRGANVRYVAIAGLLAVKHHPPKKIEE
ncbi:MAG: hypothetical protein ABIG96_01435 [Candidatus Micrarchaeota archaeon]